MRKVLYIVCALSLIAPQLMFAGEVDDLKNKIGARNTDIQTLEREIVAIEGNLKQVGAQKTTLQSALKEIELTRQKLAANISLTEKKIDAANAELATLTSEIGQKGQSIDAERAAIGESARTLHELDNQSIIEILLGNETMGKVIDHATTLTQLTAGIDESLGNLKLVKQSLEINKSSVAEEQAKLVGLKRTLAAQKAIEDGNRKEKLDLIAQTKGQESQYKKLLSDKQAQKDAFEAELNAYEAQLKFAIDPSTIPKEGTKALLWPVRDPFVTQYFGDTAFSKSAAGAVYNGHGHNAIDLRASVGTPIYAAASGSVVGTGDTDLTCRGASYGRWILIEHTNGLSTLYAHLSYIGVRAGQSVVSGDQIGYSGSTGYAVGPHLHFSVYVAKGVSIKQLKSKNKKCGVYTLPVAPFNSYLNPLLFL